MAQLPGRTIMGIRGRLAVGGLTVLLLAACGTGTAAGPGRPATPTAAPVPGDPVGLVGLWSVREAAGEEPGAILRIGDDLSLWRECGHLFGFWRATAEGLFVANVDGGSNACYTGPASVPAWLRQAVGQRTVGPDRLLVDRDGRTLARLVPGGRPTVGADTVPSEGEPPVVTDELRRRLAPAVPVPAGLRPATADDLVGRWVPANGTGARVPRPPNDGSGAGVPRPPGGGTGAGVPRPPGGGSGGSGLQSAHAELRADGGWSGSDGCNGQGGRWVAGTAGSLLAVGGPQTLIGCENVDVGGWLTGAARAGLTAGGQLVLLDGSGRELGRLRPA
jgi:hypothetical protein